MSDRTNAAAANAAYLQAEANRAALRRAVTKENREAAQARVNASNAAAVAAFGGEGGPVAYTREGEKLINVLPILASLGLAPEVSRSRFVAGETYRKLGPAEAGAVAGTINRFAGAQARADRAMPREDVMLLAKYPTPVLNEYQLVLSTTQLIRAAATGDDATVRRLVAEGAPLDLTGNGRHFGYTALMWAIRNNHERCVEALLSVEGRKADVNYGSTTGFVSPLTIAIHRNNVNIVRMLLENGANANFPRKAFYNPLYTAILDGYVEIVELLLEHGADPNLRLKNILDSPLLTAVGNRSGFAEVTTIRIVSLLLAHGADINARATEGGHTPLHIAQQLFGPHSGLVEFLKSKGATLGGGRRPSRRLSKRKHRKTRRTTI